MWKFTLNIFFHTLSFHCHHISIFLCSDCQAIRASLCECVCVSLCVTFFYFFKVRSWIIERWGCFPSGNALEIVCGGDATTPWYFFRLNIGTVLSYLSEKFKVCMQGWLRQFWCFRPDIHSCHFLFLTKSLQFLSTLFNLTFTTFGNT